MSILSRDLEDFMAEARDAGEESAIKRLITALQWSVSTPELKRRIRQLLWDSREERRLQRIAERGGRSPARRPLLPTGRWFCD